MEILRDEEKSTSSPYQVILSNDTDNTLNGILFGFNANFLSENFGSDDKLKIVGINGTVQSYSMLLAQSGSRPFKVGKTRLFVTGENQLKKIKYLVINEDANGQKFTTTKLFLIDSHQFQSGIFDSSETFVIDGSSMLEIEVPPKTTYTFLFYPSETINLSRLFNRVIKFFTVPSLESRGEIQYKGMSSQDLVKQSHIKISFWQRLKNWGAKQWWKEEVIEFEKEAEDSAPYADTISEEADFGFTSQPSSEKPERDA